MNSPATPGAVWAQQAVWSQTASRLKTSIERMRSCILILVVATAILETLGAQLAARTDAHATTAQVLAGAGMVLMAVAAFLQGQGRSGQAASRWIRARAVSEALKEHLYRYLTGTGDYEVADREEVLRRKTQKVLAEVEDLEPEAATVEVPERELPAVHNLEDYATLRVRAQIEGYYRPRARTLAVRRKTWRRVQTGLMALTAVLSALVALVPDTGLPGWVAVLTTIAGTLGAHVEAAHYDQLIISYRATASRLEWLLTEWQDSLSKTPATPEQRADFVNRCEDAISVQNQAWLAGWATQD